MCSEVTRSVSAADIQEKARGEKRLEWGFFGGEEAGT
ncbi:MAG: hypothetical protein JWL77_4168 [Chthonomonadaceae bacterium]|nr:hypothetical protein [Chthonomonadaceae bacterium]